MTATCLPKSTGLADPTAKMSLFIAFKSLISVAPETCSFSNTVVLFQCAEEQDRAGSAGIVFGGACQEGVT